MAELLQHASRQVEPDITQGRAKPSTELSRSRTNLYKQICMLGLAKLKHCLGYVATTILRQAVPLFKKTRLTVEQLRTGMHRTGTGQASVWVRDQFHVGCKGK